MFKTLFAICLFSTLCAVSLAQSGYGGDGKVAGDSSSTINIRLYEAAPGAATTALAGAGAGNVDNGAHIVKVTCYTPAGQTTGGTASNTTTVADKTVNGKIALTNIPPCSSIATGRKVYMTTAGGSTYYLVSNGTIADNTTTTLTVNDADATLTASTVLPTTNTALDTRQAIGQNGFAQIAADFSYGRNGSNIIPTGKNIFIGYRAGNTTSGSTAANTYEASNNIALGVQALNSITTGYSNIAFGNQAMFYTTTGYQNLAFGDNAFRTMASGHQNTGIGIGLPQALSGNSNVLIGYGAGNDLAAASNNIIVGYFGSALGLTSGSNNTIIGGSITGLSSSLANNVILADGAGNKRIWIDNNGTVSYGGGAVASVIGAAATHGQAYAVLQGEELLTIAASATTDTSMQIPANAVVLSVSVRVTTAIPTATTFTVTGATSGTTFNTAAVSVNLNSTDPGTKAGPYYNSTAQSVRITPDGTPGTNAGRVRVTVTYYVVTPPTS